MEIQDRLKMIMKMHSLTASSFADRIGVQRSSVSHIMSGRNKPSLDFIEKTLVSFPRVDAGWLVLGKQSSSQVKIEEVEQPKIEDESRQSSHSASNIESKQEQKAEKEHNQRTITKVVVFYSDGTFEER